MAKATTTKNTEASNDVPSIDTEGYELVNSDVLGFYDECRPIKVVPFGVSLFDGKSDKHKPSAIIMARLLEDALVMSPEKNDDSLVQCHAGDVIGIWGKAGNRALVNYADCKVIIVPTGTKDVGKPQPMKTFNVMAAKGSRQKRLPVVEDKRDKSDVTPTIWASASAAPVHDKEIF